MKYRFLIAGFLLAIPAISWAANPSVQSFVPSATSMNSGQVISFTWQAADSGGSSFFIPCNQGFKFKNTDGSTFACNTAYAFGTGDGLSIMAWNLSGVAKSFTARLTPKDATGADYPYGRQDVTVTVTPVTNPIETATGATTTPSNTPYTLSWTSSILDGINFSISCSANIRTTSSSYTGYTPCNTPVFAGDLPGSGSLVLSFDNSSPLADTITLTLLPAMSPGAYNGAGSRSVTVSVDTHNVPDPTTTSFTSGTTTDRILTGIPLSLSWTTEKSAGVNFLFSCNDNITTTITVNGASSTPKCSTLAFDTALAPNGGATVSFENKGYASESTTITLAPGKLTGGFDATRGRELSFLVLPKGATLPSASVSTPITSTVTTTPQKQAAKTLFTKYLARGSSNAEVRALQTLLAKDSSIYPEGVINGYFGPATERALKRFQEKNNIAKKRTAGYGTVGPKTRTLLNQLAQ